MVRLRLAVLSDDDDDDEEEEEEEDADDADEEDSTEENEGGDKALRPFGALAGAPAWRADFRSRAA